MKRIYIDTRNNDELFNTVLAVAEQFGHRMTIQLEERDNVGAIAWRHTRCPKEGERPLDGSGFDYWSGQSDAELVSPSEFVKFLSENAAKNNKVIKPYEKLISLNEEYRANVTKANVKVGCQTFSHSVIADLYNASIEAQKAEV